jgi:type II restriction/modification system DNA methylase subunit YeeA
VSAIKNPMTPEQFIAIWKDNKLTERGGAQAHFDDLCDLLGVEKPRDPENYCFERGAKKSAGGEGWANVWKRGCFGWENKKPGRDLDTALKQLTDYALQLENPPLLVVSDRERIIIHTAFTGYPDEPREIRIEDLTDPARLQLLRWVFTDPVKLRPEKSTAAITEEAAGQFAALAKAMRQRGLNGQQVAHFLVQCLFCMFAEDENLLPADIFTDLLKNAGADTGKAERRILTLFTAMQNKNGEYGDHDIAWFNGGLFKSVDIPALTTTDLTALYEAAADMDWRAIDPTIFGTLFERGLDPACWSGNFLYLALIALRDVEKLAHIEAQEFGFEPELLMQTGPHNIRGIEINEFAAELARVTVWIGDIQWCRRNGREIARHPILRALDGIEHRDALVTANPPQPPFQKVGSLESPPSIKGDLGGFCEAHWPSADVIIGNPPFLGGSKMLGELGSDYVEKLCRCYEGRVPGGADLVTYWFEKARQAITPPPAPSLESEGGGVKSSPPVVGGAGGGKVLAGFVATNSIRGGSNREVLKRICASGWIFNAWSDEPWINDGAAVRVSLVCFENKNVGARSVTRPPLTFGDDVNDDDDYNKGGSKTTPLLNGNPVSEIYADLTGATVGAGLALAQGCDLTTAQVLEENKGICFMGASKKGSFDIPGELARQWLTLPSNPNGRTNSDVLRPILNAIDIARRTRDMWIVDFGNNMSENDAALFEAPFQYVLKHVKPERENTNDKTVRENWWRHGRPRTDMREALKPFSRYIATPAVAKHRLFVWIDTAILPDQATLVFASDSDTTFGILHSRFHELWSLRMCTWLGKGNDPRYTPTTCFETFPFPAGITPNPTPLPTSPLKGEEFQNTPSGGVILPPLQGEGRGGDGVNHASAIASAAVTLNHLRENWLNPPEWADWVITPQEEKGGFPKRPVAKPGHEADLKKRTLTNLYNSRPAWLENAHKALDTAVAAAYGWPSDLSDEEILSRLLALNLKRTTG